MMLEQERKYFKAHRAELLRAHAGKFALVKHSILIGIFASPGEALAEGARRFGKESFLVRRIEEKDPLIYLPALTLGILRADTTHPA